MLEQNYDLEIVQLVSDVTKKYNTSRSEEMVKSEGVEQKVAWFLQRSLICVEEQSCMMQQNPP
jgi:hypothetical protein